jgi:hypothetical protein
LFRNFCLLLKWKISFIGRCRKSGNHPSYEGLAKFGYKPEIKWKSLVIFLYIWLHNEYHIKESGDCICVAVSPPRIQKFTFQVLLQHGRWTGDLVGCMVPFLVKQGNVNLWSDYTEPKPTQNSVTCKHWFAPTIWSLPSSSWITNSLQQSRFEGQLITKNKLFVCKLRNGSPKRVRGVGTHYALSQAEI